LFALAIYRADYGCTDYRALSIQVSNTLELGSSRAFDCRPRFGTYGVTYERPTLTYTRISVERRAGHAPIHVHTYWCQCRGAVGRNKLWIYITKTI